MYKKVTTLLGNEFVVKFGIDTPELWIPEDPANSDYQAYLNRDNPKDEPNV